MLEFPIHPTDPLPPLRFEESCRSPFEIHPPESGRHRVRPPDRRPDLDAWSVGRSPVIFDVVA